MTNLELEALKQKQRVPHVQILTGHEKIIQCLTLKEFGIIIQNIYEYE